MNHISGHIAQIRQDYQQASLSEQETGDNPVSFFQKWFSEAEQAQVSEVNAMTLATVDSDGKPDARIVLLKGISDEGHFIFFTNYQSQKGQELAENPYATLVFFWKELERQVRIYGEVQKVSPQESDEYFYSRPKGSQIGAIASPQSTSISRQQLEEKVNALTLQYENEKIVRPEYWGGYRVMPYKIEFWQGRHSRLHDRIVFEIDEQNEDWDKYRIAP